MANLPSLQTGAAFLNVPEQSNLGALTQAPYTMIAEGVGFLGHRLEKALEPMARQAGSESVIRDENGQLQVRQRMEWTDTDRAYNAGALQSYRVQRLDEGSRGLRDLRRQFEGRPAEFDAAATAYTRQFMRDTPAEMRPFIQGEITAESRRYGEGLADQRMQLDKQREINSFNSRISTLNSDLDSLAQAEGGTNTPEYQQKAAELADLRRQMAANPRYAYTEEQRAADEQDRRIRDITQGAAGAAYRLYKQNGDIAAAERMVEERIMDPALPLSAAERAKARGEAMSAITSGHAARQAQVAELRQERDLLVADLQAGREVDPTRVNALVQRFTGLRANGDAYALRSAQAVNTVVRGFNGSTPSERIRIYDEMRRLSGSGGGAANTATPEEAGAFQYFSGQGYSRVQAAAITSYMLQESTLNPNANNPKDGRDGSDSIGVGQWNAERAQALRAFAAARGTPVNDRDTQFAFLAHELNTTHKAAGDRLRAATTPEEATAAMVQFGAPGGYRPGPDGHLGVPSWGSRLGNTRRINGGDGGGSSVYAAAIREAQTRLDADAKKAVEDYDKAVTANQNVTDEEKATLVQLVSRTSSQEVRDQLMGKLGGAEVERIIRSLPPDQARQVAANLQRRAVAGEAGPYEREIATRAVEAARRQDEQRRNDPVQHFIDTRSTQPAVRDIMGPPLPVVDTSSPQALGASIDQRVRTGRMVEADNGGGSISPFTGQDAQAIGQALARGNPQDVPAILEALRTRVPEASLQPMLRQEPIRDAIQAMAKSNDPAKQSAAMQFLDAMQTRIGATQFNSLVDERSREILSDWQRRGRSEDPVRFSERWSRADDPQVRAARDENRRAGEKLATDEFTPDQVANIVTDRWLGSIRPSVAPSAQMDGGQRGVMMQDWKRIMGEEFARADGDKDVAKKAAEERIRQLWGPSVANNGRVMRYRPETVFEPVGNSHDWVAEQVTTQLTATLGRAGVPVRPDEVPTMAGVPLVRYGIFPTADTEAQIAAYRRNPAGVGAVTYQGFYEHPVTKKVEPFTVTIDRNAALNAQRATDSRRLAIGQEAARDAIFQRDLASGQTMIDAFSGVRAEPNLVDETWSTLRRSAPGPLDVRARTFDEIARRGRGRTPTGGEE